MKERLMHHALNLQHMLGLEDWEIEISVGHYPSMDIHDGKKAVVTIKDSADFEANLRTLLENVLYISMIYEGADNIVSAFSELYTLKRCETYIEDKLSTHKKHLGGMFS